MPSALSSVVYNRYNPVCSLSPCLQQVIGRADGNPLAQFAACTSSFGSPTVSTVTLSDDIVFSTSTSTSSYTDIIVSLATTTSTAEETITSYVNAYETITAFTTTIVTTLTATTVAPTYILVKKDAGSQQVKKKLRGCGGHPPVSSSTVVSKLLASSSAPSSEASSVPPSSIIPVSSFATPSSSASICPSVEEYSSACDCIGAASTISTVTLPASTSTSIVYETTTTTIPSVTESTITIIETTVIIQPTTTTATTTLNTAAYDTVTVITTTTPVAPTQTANIVIVDGPQAGKQLSNASPKLKWNTGTGIKIAVAMQNQTPWLPGQPNLNLYMYSPGGPIGALGFLTPASVPSYAIPPIPVSCSVDVATGYLSCANGRGQSKVMLCEDEYIYLANPTFTYPACTETRLKLSHWLS